MKIRHAGGRSVGKTRQSVEWLRECWGRGLTTMMVSGMTEAIRPEVRRDPDYLAYLETIDQFTYYDMMEGSWDKEEGN